MKILRVLALLLLLGGCAEGCVSSPPIEGTAPAEGGELPFGVEAVAVEGTCAATLGATLRVGPIMLPFDARLDTRAGSAGETTGQVSMDIGGLVSALCVVSPDMGPIGRCAVGGLASRLVPPAPAASTPDASP